VIDRAPLDRTTRQLIEDGRARQDALSTVDEILARVTGTARDTGGMVEVTVDDRGRLLSLRLAPDARRYGAERLGQVVVEVARAAMDEATQAGYNKVAPLLGDTLTQALEQLSGRATPARQARTGGITAEEFQAGRAERLRRTAQETADDGRTNGGPDPADELASFDPSSLRSDR
jgi:DNA-binding protein YbaB